MTEILATANQTKELDKLTQERLQLEKIAKKYPGGTAPEKLRVLTAKIEGIKQKSQGDRQEILQPGYNYEKPVVMQEKSGVTISQGSRGYSLNSYNHSVDNITGSSFSRILREKLYDSGPKGVYGLVVNSLKHHRNNPEKLQQLISDTLNLLAWKYDGDAFDEGLRFQISGETNADRFAQFLSYENLFVPGAMCGPIHGVMARMLHDAGYKTAIVDGVQTGLSESTGGAHYTVVYELGNNTYGWNNYSQPILIEGVKNMSEALKYVTKRSENFAVNAVQNAQGVKEGQTYNEFMLSDVTYYFNDINGKVDLSKNVSDLSGFQHLIEKGNSAVGTIKKLSKRYKLSLNSKPEINIVTGRNKNHNVELDLSFNNGKTVRIDGDYTSNLRNLHVMFQKLSKTSSHRLTFGIAEKKTGDTSIFESGVSQEATGSYEYNKLTSKDYLFKVNINGTVGKVIGTSHTIEGNKKRLVYKILQGDGSIVFGKRLTSGKIVYVQGGVQGIISDIDANVEHSNTDRITAGAARGGAGELDLTMGFKGDSFSAEAGAFWQEGRDNEGDQNWQLNQGWKGGVELKKDIIDPQSKLSLHGILGANFKYLPEIFKHKQLKTGINGEYINGKFVYYASVEGVKTWGENLLGKINDSHVKAKVGLGYNISENASLYTEILDTNERDPYLSIGVNAKF